MSDDDDDRSGDDDRNSRGFVALDALGLAFREVGRKRMEARRMEEARRLKEARRARRKQVLIRGVLTAFGVVALSGGIAVGINSFVSDDGSDVGGDPTPGHIAPRKATDRLLARSTVADPQNGPGWGLSTYTSQQDEDCVIAARVVNGRMGVVNHGKFTAFRKNVSGFCDDLSRDHLMFTVRRYSRSNGARTLLFGQAERDVQRIVLQHPRNRRNVHVFSDGTFLVVFTGDNALRGSRLVATISGRPRVYRLG